MKVESHDDINASFCLKLNINMSKERDDAVSDFVTIYINPYLN